MKKPTSVQAIYEPNCLTDCTGNKCAIGLLKSFTSEILIFIECMTCFRIFSSFSSFSSFRVSSGQMPFGALPELTPLPLPPLPEIGRDSTLTATDEVPAVHLSMLGLLPEEHQRREEGLSCSRSGCYIAVFRISILLRRYARNAAGTTLSGKPAWMTINHHRLLVEA